MVIGFTSGVFDLFHVGHLNLLERARKDCDFLVVAVCSDSLAFKVKGKKPVIPLEERIRIVGALKCVDRVVVESKDDKLLYWKAFKFNKIYKGSDWKGTKKWLDLEKEFKKIGVKVVYFPYTESVSSSKIRRSLECP